MNKTTLRRVGMLVGIAILFALWIASILSPAAGAKESFPTPIVSATPEGGHPVFGFSVACPGIRVSVYTDVPFYGTYEPRCGSEENPFEVLYVVFSCGEGLSGGVIQAFEEGDFTGNGGFADATVYVPCSTWVMSDPAGFGCKALGDTRLWVNLPTYGKAPPPAVECNPPV